MFEYFQVHTARHCIQHKEINIMQTKCNGHQSVVELNTNNYLRTNITNMNLE